jgi:hypothetical protein
MSRSLDTTMSWYRITWPQELKPESVVSFFDTLFAGVTKGVVIEVSGHFGNIEHRIGAPEQRAQQLRSLFTSMLPGTQLEPLLISPTSATVDEQVAVIRATNRSRSLGNAETTATALLSALSTTAPGTVTVRWQLGVSQGALVVPSKPLDPGSGSWLHDLLIAPFRGPRELDHEARTALVAKLTQRRVSALGQIAVNGSDIAHRQRLIGLMVSALRTSEQPGVRLSVKQQRSLISSDSFCMTLTARELVALVGWPIGEPTIGVHTNKHAVLRPSRFLPSSSDRTWGESTHPEGRRPLGLTVDDGLKHLHLLGPTGAA